MGLSVTKKDFRQNYLLDTNILLNGFEEFLYEHSNCGIIISGVSLAELDKLKSLPSEQGHKARVIIQKIFEYKKIQNLHNWVVIDNSKNISLKVELSFANQAYSKHTTNDDLILKVVGYCNENYGFTELVTNDINLSIKAEALGFSTKQFVPDPDLLKYTGHLELFVPDDVISDFYAQSKLSIKKLNDVDGTSDSVVYTNNTIYTKHNIYENMCITLVSNTNPKTQALSIYKSGFIRKLQYGNSTVLKSIVAKNRQQKYFLEMLLDDSIKIVAVNAVLGTGKSILATAVGLEKTMETGVYDKILYVKPLEAMGGKDIGFLPDDKNSKLLQGYAGTINNILENIFAKSEKQTKNSHSQQLTNAEYLLQKGLLSVEAPTFMRGMSYYKTYIIIDEASNISQTDIKNLLGRCGELSKVIIIGDSDQIDNPNLNSSQNGLSYAINKLKGSELFATILLDRSVRSDVAQTVADRL